jgi:hypothetical protein
VIYGLRLTSNLDLPGLIHAGSNISTGEVRLHLQETPAFLGHPRLIDFFHTSQWTDAKGLPLLRVGVFPGGCFGFFYSDGVRFIVEPKGSEIWVDWPESYTLSDACTYLLGPVMGFVLRLRGTVCLHASAVAIGDRAIALLGLPGSGKSTMAAAFARSGFPVLADDVVALSDMGDRFLVQPAYPRVNLWPDSVRELFGAEDALPRITPTWDKRYMALGENTFPFGPKPLDLAAIYVLCEREASRMAPVVEELAGGEAFMALVANSYVSHLLDRSMRALEFDAFTRLLACVSARRVRPTTDPGAILALREIVTADASRLTSAEGSLAAVRSL